MSTHLEDHLLLNHVGLWKIGAVLVEAGVGVGAAVVALVLEVRIRRPGVRRPAVGVEGQSHLVLVLVLLGHLLEGLGGRAKLRLRKVHVRVRWHPAALGRGIEDWRGVVVLVVHQGALERKVSVR